MNRKRIVLITTISLVFLACGLGATTLGAFMGMQRIEGEQVGGLMLVLACCGLPLTLVGSSVTIVRLETMEIPDNRVYLRFAFLGLLATVLVVMLITALVSIGFG